jgi:hypothetical protein
MIQDLAGKFSVRMGGRKRFKSNSARIRAGEREANGHEEETSQEGASQEESR